MKTNSSQSVANLGGKLSSFLSPSQRAFFVASSMKKKMRTHEHNIIMNNPKFCC